MCEEDDWYIEMHHYGGVPCDNRILSRESEDNGHPSLLSVIRYHAAREASIAIDTRDLLRLLHLLHRKRITFITLSPVYTNTLRNSSSRQHARVKIYWRLIRDVLYLSYITKSRLNSGAVRFLRRPSEYYHNMMIRLLNL